MEKNIKKAIAIGSISAALVMGVNSQQAHASVGSTIGGIIGGTLGASLGASYEYATPQQAAGASFASGSVGYEIGSRLGAHTQSLPSTVFHAVVNNLKSWAASMF